MKGSRDKNSDQIHNFSNKDLNFSCSADKIAGSVSSEAEPNSSHKKTSPLWSGILPPSLSIFGNSSPKNCIGSPSGRKKLTRGNNYYEGWRAAVRTVIMNGVSMRRIWGFSKTGVSDSKSDIWLLGVCYRVSQESDDASFSNTVQSEGYTAFVEDFSSRILITYRKGFLPIGDTKYSSDVNWGCMLRSSQMLVAQALVAHKLGRLWRKSPEKPLDQTYVDILHLFGDSDDSRYSIHNLLQSGKAYGLDPGSWVGPYAMCRTWEKLVLNKRDVTGHGKMALHVVSGDDGERGGAPVLCIEDISKLCFEFCGDQVEWAPILLMVPLVLGLEKVNPRYLPLLSATFTFPQSLGILGGRPGASTYIVGVQDEKAFYLDPHEVQQVVEIKKDNVDVDTSTYHCNVVRHIPLDSIDSSLAIGFYCRDKSDFDDFCSRAFDLIDQSNGAPLFTISETRKLRNNVSECRDYDPVDEGPTGISENCAQEDDWQLL